MSRLAFAAAILMGLFPMAVLGASDGPGAAVSATTANLETMLYLPDSLPAGSQGGAAVRRLDEPLPNPGCSAMPGDWMLSNGRITVVINDPSRALGNAVSGGYIIDAFVNESPVDQISQVHLYLNDQYPRMAKFVGARAVTDPKQPGAAMLEVWGTDTHDPGIDIMTTYTLQANGASVAIDTQIVSRRGALRDYVVGDAIAWGQTSQFLPGVGAAQVKRFDAAWVAGSGRDVAYGLVNRSGRFWGPAGDSWIDANGTTVTAAAGAPGVYNRSFVVAQDLAGVASAACERMGVTLGTIEGKVTHKTAGTAADGVRVTVGQNGRPLCEAVSRGGRYSMRLPVGTYTLWTRDSARAPVGEATAVVITNGGRGVFDLRVSDPAALRVSVVDRRNGGNLPAKLVFSGRAGTPDPDLGPVFERRCRNTALVYRPGERLVMPPGEYDMVVCRGIEYDITTVPLSLAGNVETSLTIPLARAVDLGDYLQADFHQHMMNSFDSAIPLDHRVIGNVCEGINLVAATDHNYLTNLSPVIAQLGLGPWLRSLIGDEMTTRDFFFGHFNAFPIEPDPHRYGNGAIPFEKRTAAQIFADADAHPGTQVIQVNHPRSGDIGYFNRCHLSPRDASTTHPNWSPRFTAIELLNGKNNDEFEESLVDWFNLLNAGFQFTATGNSDSHRIHDQEPGYPRNLIPWAGGSAAELTHEEAANLVNLRRNVVVTNGPVVSFATAGGTQVGGTEASSQGKVVFRVAVRGANFVQPSSLTLYGNGVPVREIRIDETATPLKWEGELAHAPVRDTWYCVVVRGARPLTPVVLPLRDGQREIPVTPLAFTNPIWMDRDSDGKFIAVNAHLEALLSQDRSGEALSKLDEMASQSKVRGQFKKPKSGM